MTSGFLNSTSKYYYQPYLQKRNGNKIFSSRPLLIIDEGTSKVLCYLRDIDMSMIVKEREKYIFGVMKILKTDRNQKEVLFEMKGKIHIINLREGFQNYERGEVYWKTDDLEIRWHIDHIRNEYIMSIPSIKIKNEDIYKKII
jgi:hypothetical protein